MDSRICLGIFVVFVTATVSGNPVGDYEDRDCVLDHDGTNEKLEQCLEKGEVFIRDYMRMLSRNKLQEFNVCYEFKGFGHCIEDLWRRCPTIRHVTYKHWKPVVDLLTCSCNTTIEKHACHHDRQCLEAEVTGVLVQRCDELYTFNVNQHTWDKCVFLKEDILCKTSLVTSACGDHVGKAAYSMSKINERKTIEKSRCYISLDDPYEGFKYTEQCPRDFKDDVQECYAGHLEKFTGYFQEDNNLVVDGKAKDLRDMCSGWREFKHCTRTVRAECKRGVELLYEQNGTLRSMMLKLDYICKEARDEYQTSLYCLQDVVIKDHLKECNDYWRALEPYRTNTTSYEFYCQANNKNTYGMTMALEDLRQCYETVFSIKCSSNAGSIMSELIRRAFSDPFYLRYAYKADCDLHKVPSSIKRSPPPPSTHRRHQRHHDSREHPVGNNEPIIVTERTHVSQQKQSSQNSDSPLQNLESSAVSIMFLTEHCLFSKLFIGILTLCFNYTFVFR